VSRLLVGVAVLVVVAVAGACLLARRVRRAERAASVPFAEAAGPHSGDRAGRPAADALVVFGATVDRDGPCAELRARLDHAVALWRAGVAPVVMVSGGIVGDIDEIDAMAGYLVAQGIPGDAVAEVRPGHTTRATLETLRGLGERRYVAVSSPYHAHRIGAEARRQGLRVTVSAPRSTPETRHPPTHRARLASELAALVLYALPPGLAAHVGTGPGTLRHRLPHVLAGQVGSRTPGAARRRRST